ncbi:glycosyltransferase [Gordonia paraffinivorans]|uniref:Chondroitin polymerase n=2 Tax=Gordonia paraffinivorans TaxID=175628 RepID=A0ABD7V1J4_9ACTN|nr:glycosyltransferase family 2 protein [Gordonia paraffinivorans]MCD2146750.1 glycosyltransferase [Gordonia paraffinivorans]VFA88050.1 Chondroitin polymerase [Gordonia paraffinivorans]
MKLSAVVPAYNEESAVGRCIESLLNQTRPFDEIIIVDNASTDSTAAVVSSYAARNPSIRLVSESVPGIYHARRAGFDAATGDVLARTDADSVVSPRWAEAIEAHFAGPRGSEYQALTGPGQFGESPPFDPLRKLESRSKLFEKGGEGLKLIGPNMVMSVNAWRDIRDDLIDDNAIFEDADVSLRLLETGHRIWFSPDVAIEQSPRQLRHSPWENRQYLLGGYRLARLRGDRKLLLLSLLDLPFRFVLYTIWWLTYRPWDPETSTWRPHRLFIRLDREHPLISDSRSA